MKALFIATSLVALTGFSHVGNAQAPELVKDINPGGGSFPEGMTAYNGKTYFSAFTDVSNGELWVSDGTAGGTQILKEINPAGDSYPQDFIVCNDKLFFTADDGVHGRELWVTDGTTLGTQLVKEINPMGNIEASNFKVYNSKLYFSAHSPLLGNELWVSDGTAVGTLLVKDINMGVDNSNSLNYTVFNGFLYFSAQDATGYYNIWKSDGTAAGTIKIKDRLFGYNFNEMGGNLYFAGTDDAIGGIHALWRLNGSTNVFEQVKQISVSDGMVVCGANLFFSSFSPDTGYEPWISDGTTLGTHIIKDIVPGWNSSDPTGMTVYGGKVYFKGFNGGYGLWVSDGTESGTTYFTNLDVKNKEYGVPMIVYNDKLYVVGSGLNADEAYQVWEIDGNPANTHIVAPAIAPNPEPCEYTRLYVSNGSLYFKATYTSSVGRELYKVTTAATGIRHLPGKATISIYPNPVSSSLYVQTDQPVNLLLTDIAGRIVLRADKSSELDMRNLNSGIYLLHVNNRKGDKLAIEKLLKQ